MTEIQGSAETLDECQHVRESLPSVQVNELLASLPK